MYDPTSLPNDLPAPIDDGATDHLRGMRVPRVPLLATNGDMIDLAAIGGTVVIFAYPRTGRPGVDPLVPDWDEIPGGRARVHAACQRLP